jgi:hypothetical protein
MHTFARIQLFRPQKSPEKIPGFGVLRLSQMLFTPSVKLWLVFTTQMDGQGKEYPCQ